MASVWVQSSVQRQPRQETQCWTSEQKPAPVLTRGTLREMWFYLKCENNWSSSWFWSRLAKWGKTALLKAALEIDLWKDSRLYFCQMWHFHKIWGLSLNSVVWSIMELDEGRFVKPLLFPLDYPRVCSTHKMMDGCLLMSPLDHCNSVV